MPSSRRTFLKTSLIAGASATLPAFAATSEPAQHARAAVTPAHQAADGEFTRGIGVYPGAPAEYFGPTFEIDNTTYRNLALLRPATASSSYDYNLTAQLVTDGIKDTRLPRWIASGTSTDGILPKPQRETLVNQWPAAGLTLTGNHATAYLHLAGGEDVPEVDRIAVFVAASASLPPDRITFTLSTSDDGQSWVRVASITNPPLYDGRITFPPDLNRGNNLFYPTLPLDQPTRSRFYQVELTLAGVPEDASFVSWRLGQLEFYSGTHRHLIGGPHDFTSAWMSAGLGEEWVAVDLGAPCTFDRVTLSWIARAAEGALQVSNDGITWRTLIPLPAATDNVDDFHFHPPSRARHLRVLMTRPTSPDGYILSEFEVFGRGGPIARPAAAALAKEGRLNLAGGAWRLQRDSLVEAPGVTLSTPAFSDKDWVVATVPGTILTSYLNAGAIPDPNFGQNQLHISDSFFYADFWYRTTFTPPPATPGQLQWLTFDGINWKAEVFLNGEHLGQINGGFMRARFNITARLKPGSGNILAVRVLKNATPGACKQKTFESPGPNGGALGADNPTFHSSIGWDWIPTIRGRNTGIWGEVAIETTGAVTLEDPSISSILTEKNQAADVTIQLELANHSTEPLRGSVRGTFGSIPFQHPVILKPSSRTSVTIPPLHIPNPKLWWPTGYGDPHLHDVTLTFETADGAVLHRKSFKAGIRQMTATETGGALKLFINGRRFIPRGGNWGFAESMLRYRAREYDAAVRYHREMNFTMIRNWVGQVPDDAFYEACDRHGIVVWQDFWLANPWDGPIPDGNALFLANARDTILRIRRHASIGLYCGRNEGYPPPALESGLRVLLAELHPDIHYIGSSADDVVSGHGPYRALPPKTYFQHADTKFHSEIGMPNIPSIESVRAMMPEAAIWPMGLDWGLHDFSQTGAQGASSFRGLVEDGYGGATNGPEWITLAQFINFEGYRAMFEAQSRDRMGVLLWMSHPCWPSFVWQTYDFYLEPTAAYFACKKACEPLHIQWNRLTGFVEVVNYSAGSLTALTAQAEILNLDGSSAATQHASLDSPEDSNNPCIKLAFPAGLTPVHFLRLTLTQGANVLSTNLYLRGHEEGNYRAIRELRRVRLTESTTSTRQGDTWLLTTQLTNPTSTPALMVRLIATRATTGDRILPALYSDNYITLMPSETRILTTRLNHADTRNQTPRIQITGFNS